ncbi:hypothetical protein Tco_1482594 [Tanacetum coccineum]
MQTQENKFNTGKALDAGLVVTESRQQHAEQPKLVNEGRVNQDAEQNQAKSPLLDPSLDNKTIKFPN